MYWNGRFDRTEICQSDLGSSSKPDAASALLWALLRRNPDSAHYCGTHMNSGGKDGKGKRVPCPADPNHTVLERQLEAHLKVGKLEDVSR